MMAAAHTLPEERAADRDLFLFDTFEGMPRPDDADVDFSGQRAVGEYLAQRTEGGGSTWCAATQDEVRTNLARTGCAAERVKLVPGRVEETIPGQGPERIALLRLDTDWYSSTLHELVHLYPRLSTGGVLVIDDYGHWAGARRAVDEYFAENGRRPFLSRIDYSGRIRIKRT